MTCVHKHLKNGKTILDKREFWKWLTKDKLKKISKSTDSGEQRNASLLKGEELIDF